MYNVSLLRIIHIIVYNYRADRFYAFIFQFEQEYINLNYVTTNSIFKCSNTYSILNDSN